MAATHQELPGPRVLHRLSRRSVDESSEPVQSLVEMSDDEEYDEDALARLADSIQSEGGRLRKHVSWNTVSPGRRSGSLDQTIRQSIASRRSLRPSLYLTDSREGGSDIRGRSQQRRVDTDDTWGGSENPATPTPARPSGSRASRRGASLVFLGFWALFGVGTLAGSRHSPLSTSSVSLGRVLTPMDGQAPPVFEVSTMTNPDHEPQAFRLVAILSDVDGAGSEDLPPPDEDLPIQKIIGRISAWICTIMYLTSRLPQIWKNVGVMTVPFLPR